MRLSAHTTGSAVRFGAISSSSFLRAYLYTIYSSMVGSYVNEYSTVQRMKTVNFMKEDVLFIKFKTFNYLFKFTYKSRGGFFGVKRHVYLYEDAHLL